MSQHHMESHIVTSDQIQVTKQPGSRERIDMYSQWVKRSRNSALMLVACLALSFSEKAFSQAASVYTSISPRLVDLLLDPDLLNPQKVSEFESLIGSEDQVIQDIYVNSKNEVDKFTQYGAVERLVDTVKELTSSINDHMTHFQKNNILSMEKETDVFIVGGGMELLYQFMHNSNQTKKSGTHINFLPISRAGFPEFHEEFKSYLKSRFLNSLTQNRNLLIVDSTISGETLQFINKALSEVLDSKRINNESFHVATIGFGEIIGMGKEINEELHTYKSNLVRFYKGESSSLPIFKARYSAYGIAAVHQLPRSHPGKFKYIGAGGVPTNIEESQPILELKQHMENPNRQIELSRSLSVFLKRRFQSFEFFKRYYAKMQLNDPQIFCSKLLL